MEFCTLERSVVTARKTDSEIFRPFNVGQTGRKREVASARLHINEALGLDGYS